MANPNPNPGPNPNPNPNPNQGLAPLAKELFPELTCLGLLTNPAIAPERRRTGLGRALCEWCG